LSGGPFSLTLEGLSLSEILTNGRTDSRRCSPPLLDSSIRRLSELADPTLEPMINEEMDQLLYGDQGIVP